MAAASGPEDRGAHGVAVAELGRWPLRGDPALDQEVGSRGQAERPLDVLLDEQDADPLGAAPGQWLQGSIRVAADSARSQPPAPRTSHASWI
jgi:hypothetical protein